MNRARAGTTRTLHNFTGYLLSDVAPKRPVFRLKIVKNFLINKSEILTKLCAKLCTSGRTISALVLLAMAAPLRRIVARDVVITLPDARNPRYRIYSLIDQLECGHEYSSYLFGGLEDLTFAYTLNPAITARRRRCRPCAQLTATRKPMQTVTAIPAAKTA